MASPAHSYKYLLFILCTWILSVGFGRKAPDVNDVCNSGLKGFRESIETAQLELQNFRFNELGGRVPASVEFPKGLRHWMNWSVSQLESIQLQIDGIDPDPSLKVLKLELNQLANDLVLFYGYAEARSVSDMLRMLSEMTTRASEARRIACLSSLAKGL